jgi:predicted nucleic acid-binding protein
VAVDAVVLDTSVVIDLERVDRGGYAHASACVSAVTIAELASGVTGAEADVRRARLRRVLVDFEVLPFGVEEGKLYGELAELVRLAGRNPRPRRLDLQIAATAASWRLPLLTMNPDDFVGVDRLVDVVPISRAPGS